MQSAIRKQIQLDQIEAGNQQQLQNYNCNEIISKLQPYLSVFERCNKLRKFQRAIFI